MALVALAGTGVIALSTLKVARANSPVATTNWVAGLAQKLNLPQSQLQTAIDELRNEQRQARW